MNLDHHENWRLSTVQEQLMRSRIQYPPDRSFYNLVNKLQGEGVTVATAAASRLHVVPATPGPGVWRTVGRLAPPIIPRIQERMAKALPGSHGHEPADEQRAAPLGLRRAENGQRRMLLLPLKQCRRVQILYIMIIHDESFNKWLVIINTNSSLALESGQA
jgi:hypothetical protein